MSQVPGLLACSVYSGLASSPVRLDSLSLSTCAVQELIAECVRIIDVIVSSLHRLGCSWYFLRPLSWTRHLLWCPQYWSSHTEAGRLQCYHSWHTRSHGATRLSFEVMQLRRVLRQCFLLQGSEASLTISKHLMILMNGTFLSSFISDLSFPHFFSHRIFCGFWTSKTS